MDPYGYSKLRQQVCGYIPYFLYQECLIILNYN
jgi:hypothetical protein